MSAAFRITLPLRFYKNDRTRAFSNPMRRWYYHYLIAGGIALGIGYVVAAYQLAKWEAYKYGDTSGRFVCASGLREFLSLCPFNSLSNLTGQLAEPGPLPKAVHHKVIDFLVRFYHVDLSDSERNEFESLQDFYVRRWAPGARPIDREAVAVAPCDGEVLAVFNNITENALVQVKGLTYGVQSLFRTAPKEVPRGFKRVAFVVHLRVQDYHHVIAPATFACDNSVYVPGELLPATAAGYHWLPGVLTTNERIVVHGGAAAGSTQPLVALAMVGSTLTGRMKLALDRRIRTNFLDPPDYAVHSSYAPSRRLSVGADVGTFYWGSSVVLMMDVPERAQVMRKVGDVVKAGEALVR